MIYLFLPQIDTEHLFKFFIVSVIKPIRFSSKLHFPFENRFKILLVSRQASPGINFSHHQIIDCNKHPLDSHLNSNDQASYNHNNPFTSLSDWSKKKRNPFHDMPYKKMLFITWTNVIMFPWITSKEISFVSLFPLWLDYSFMSKNQVADY